MKFDEKILEIRIQIKLLKRAWKLLISMPVNGLKASFSYIFKK